jgi:hypothetical protein
MVPLSFYFLMKSCHFALGHKRPAIVLLIERVDAYAELYDQVVVASVNELVVEGVDDN